MASLTLTGMDSRWPEGTSLSIYPLANFGSSTPPVPGQAPLGSATATASVSGDAVTFIGLADDTAYVVTDSGGTKYLRAGTQVDHSTPVRSSRIGAASGVAGLDSSTRIPVAQLPTSALRSLLSVPDVEITAARAVEPNSLTPLKLTHRGPSGTLYGFYNTNLATSTDEGATWTSLNSGALPTGITAASQFFRVFETAAGSLLVVSFVVATNQHSIFRSTDSGANFTKVMDFAAPSGSSVPRPLCSQSICQAADGTLYVGEYNAAAGPNDARLYKSTDDGATWTTAFSWLAAGPAADRVRHIHAVRIDPFANSGNRVWITIGDTGTQPRIGYSDNAGSTWTWVSTGQYPESRAIGLVFTPTAVYWLSDTPDEAAQFYKWTRASQAITSLGSFAGHSGSSAWLSGGVIVHASNVEPDLNWDRGDDFVHLWASADGANVRSTKKWRRTQVDRTTKATVYHVTEPNPHAHSFSLGSASAGVFKPKLTVVWPEGTVVYTGADVAYNASAATLATAIQAATGPNGETLPASSVSGSGGPLPGAVTLTYKRGLAGADVQPLTYGVQTLVGHTLTSGVTTRGGYVWATAEALDGTETYFDSLYGFKFRGYRVDAGDQPTSNLRVAHEAASAPFYIYGDLFDPTTNTASLTQTSLEIIEQALDDLVVEQASFIHSRGSDLVMDASNYWTIKVQAYRAGTVVRELFQLVGQSSTWTALRTVAMPLNAGTPALPYVASGDGILLRATKTGSPGALTHSRVTLRARRLNRIAGGL